MRDRATWETFTMKMIVQAPAVAIGVFLVYWLTNTLSARIDANTSALGVNTAVVATLKENLLLHSVDTSYTLKQLDHLASINRAMCINASETPAERDRCLQ